MTSRRKLPAVPLADRMPRRLDIGLKFLNRWPIATTGDYLLFKPEQGQSMSLVT